MAFARRNPDRRPRRPGRAWLRGTTPAAVVLACACAAGCTSASPATTATATAPGPGSSSPTPTATRALAATTTQGDSCPQRRLTAMSEQQRIGQVFVVGVPTNNGATATATATAAAAAAAAGGYILYGGSAAAATSVRTLTDAVSSRLTGGAGGVRPFVAVDQEGGQVQALTGPGFSTIPSALSQGAWATDRLEQAAQSWGEQLRGAGVNVDLAPVLDVVPAWLGGANQPIGRYDREYGHTVSAVSDHGVAVAAGLQSAGIAATAKHFPGLGRVLANTDTSTDVTDAVTTGTDAALQPFRAAIGAGTRFVMLSLASYPRIDPAHLAVFSPAVVTLLRTALHFRGLIISDDLGAADQVSAVSPGRRSLDFLAAGGQIVLVVRPTRMIPTMVASLTAAVDQDSTVRAQVDTAALAVLTAKQSMGLLTC